MSHPPRPDEGDASAATGGDAAAAEIEIYEDDDEGYSLDHLSAVLRPVALTMVLAS
jgi:hypothetical protein